MRSQLLLWGLRAFSFPFSIAVVARDAFVFLVGARAIDGVVVALVSFKGSTNPIAKSIGAPKMTGSTNALGMLQQLHRPIP